MTDGDQTRHILRALINSFVRQPVTFRPETVMHPPRFFRTSLLATATLAGLCTAVPQTLLHAQSETALRQAFEGKTVSVKLDMPGSSRGVDVYPLEAIPLSFRDVADRTKDYTVALRIGQSAMITKIVVKRDLIEFQLGGGGYGTFGDNTGSDISPTLASESKEERAMRDSIRIAPNSAKKKDYERALNNLRTERERENAKARAEAAQANEMRESNLRAKRSEAGSRFNVRYKPAVPPDAMTPEGLMRALAPYVDFSNVSLATAPTSSPSRPAGGSNGAPAGGTNAGTNALASIRKGLLLTEVESLLGPATTASESKEGVLTLMKRNYTYDGKRVTASFVNGVLIDYAISPV